MKDGAIPFTFFGLVLVIFSLDKVCLYSLNQNLNILTFKSVSHGPGL